MEEDTLSHAVLNPNRLSALRYLQLLDTPAEEAFERLTRLAAKVLRVPIALVSLVDGERQVFGVGLPEPFASLREMPLSHSLCQHEVASGEPLIVGDAREHPRLRDNGAVRELGVVAYAGIPLTTSDGHVLGSFSVVDTQPREWTEDEIDSLTDLTASVMTELDLRADIAERRQAEAALRSSEASYRSLFDSLTEMVYIQDREGRFLSVNEAVVEAYGYAREEIVGQTPAMLMDPERANMEMVWVHFRQALEGAPQRFEWYGLRKDGCSFPKEVTLTRGTYFGEDVVVAVARDISGRQRAEEQFRIQAAYLEELFTRSPEGVVLLDNEDRIIRANPEFVRLFGYTPEEVVGRTTKELITPEHLREEARAITERVARGETVALEAQRCRKDGSLLHVSILGTPIRLGHNRIAVYGIYRDITDERARERQLRRAERLASVGTLLGGVAHELNNPLTSIKSFAELMLTDEHTEGDREALEVIHREADRMARIVSDLRLLARQTQEEKSEATRVDLNDVAQHILKVRRYPLETGGVELHEDLAGDLPIVLADRGEMEQVVLNLVVNAEQAMAEQSGERRLTIRTRSNDKRVSLSVTDTGPGIAPTYLERIFDPFWTTKEPGEGTGLGLSLVHSIIAEHGGEIHVESEVGRGTTFRVELPRAPEMDPAPVSGEPDISRPAGALRVLVVDDEEAIRSLLARYFERRGHIVRAATDGEEALRILDEEAGNAGYDVILSDLRMPGLGGDALLQRLRERSGGLDRKLILMTGDALGGESMRTLQDAGVPILLKPFDLGEVLRLVEQQGRP